MPVSVVERFDSRQLTTGKNASLDLAYAILGTTDEAAAKAALLAASPTSYGNSISDPPYLVRQSVSLEPKGPDLWHATVRYGVSEWNPPQTGESSFAFDTGGGTQHITQSLETVSRYAAPGATAPNFGGAVGVTQDAVEGVDITIPVYNFSETHYLSAGSVTTSYKLALFAATGKVNSAAFRGFQAGEVLFLGASGTRRGTGYEDDWEITFRFAASKNRTGLVVGDITGIAKKGWEYMWVRYADAEDESAKALVKKPIAVYIERVYEDAVFSTLGIGS